MKGLRKLRKERRWYVSEVAEAAGVSAAAIYAYEKGTRFPKREVLEKLSSFFNCTIEELL